MWLRVAIPEQPLVNLMVDGKHIHLTLLSLFGGTFGRGWFRGHGVELVSGMDGHIQLSARARGSGPVSANRGAAPGRALVFRGAIDRKSTRLNSSHVKISYAVF